MLNNARLSEQPLPVPVVSLPMTSWKVLGILELAVPCKVTLHRIVPLVLVKVGVPEEVVAVGDTPMEVKAAAVAEREAPNKAAIATANNMRRVHMCSLWGFRGWTKAW